MARLSLRRATAGFCCLAAAVLALTLQCSSGASSSTRKQPVHPEQFAGPGKAGRRFSPPPLSPARTVAALQMFEKVHPTLTIHYSGFSRQGSLICYDMLNELRTVEEATALMDVEFHLLDLMLEHYQVKQHMRIVDANVVKKILNIGNLFSTQFPKTISNVTQFMKAYDPVLRVFLRRYLPHIESLVIINVPAFIVPILPAVASHMMGIPPNKIVALSSGAGLERFMERRYIPREFGNPRGFSVKDNDQDLTASCLMLQEIKEQLGEAALSKEGKATLAKHGPRLLGSRLQKPPASSSESIEAAASLDAKDSAGTQTETESIVVKVEEDFDDID